MEVHEQCEPKIYRRRLTDRLSCIFGVVSKQDALIVLLEIDRSQWIAWLAEA
jgi:hypothetical protein